MARLFKNGLYIYQKVIIIFLVLLAPIYLLSAWMNRMSADFLKGEILNSAMMNVSYYSKHLDTQFQNLKNRQLQSINDSELQEVDFLSPILDTYQDVDKINRIRE